MALYIFKEMVNKFQYRSTFKIRQYTSKITCGFLSYWNVFHSDVLPFYNYKVAALLALFINMKHKKTI